MATGQLRLGVPGHWTVTKDADPDCREIYRRHYSRRVYRDGRDPAKFVGPGQYIVLVTPNLDALFVWRRFIDDADDGTGKRQEGINCSVFLNEGPTLSSQLILEAEGFARDKWPQEKRLYTYVNPRKTRHKRDPGRCFRKAGWRPCGFTRGGLVILEKVTD
jgi:hypothetical protein